MGCAWEKERLTFAVREVIMSQKKKCYYTPSRKTMLLKSLGIYQLSKKEQKRLGQKTASKQNPNTFRRCKYIERFLTITPIVMVFLTIIKTIFVSENINPLYFCSMIAMVPVVSVLLCLVKPLYFTPWSDSDNKWRNDSMFGTQMVSLLFSIAVPWMFCIFYIFTQVHYPDPTIAILYILGIGILLGILLCIRCCAERKTLKLIGILLAVGIGVSILIITLSNAIFANREPSETFVGEVTAKDLHTDSRGGSSRSIDVAVHQDEFSFYITKDAYDNISVGDRIPVYCYSGGLGIPFVDIIKY